MGRSVWYHPIKETIMISRPMFPYFEFETVTNNETFWQLTQYSPEAFGYEYIGELE